MFFFVLLLLEIILLFFLSKLLTESLSQALSSFTKSSKTTVNIIAFLFLPGVIIHELSHLLVAGVLFVRTGEIDFMPEITKDRVKLGSAGIAKTDPIRRAIIGFAPVFVGLSVVLGIVYFAIDNSSIVDTIELNNTLKMVGAVLAFYLLFAVSNTMFSSRADMQGSAEILIAVLIIFVSAYILGFRPPLDFVQNLFTEQIVNLLQKSTLFLSAPIVIDLAILGIIRIINRR